MKKDMTIGEVSQRAGLPASTLRYYESQGLVAAPARRGGRRIYDASILEHLSVIELAKNAGFTIAEVRTLLRGFSRGTPPSKRWRSLATQKLNEIDARLEQLCGMRVLLQAVMACECPTFNDCAAVIRSRR